MASNLRSRLLTIGKWLIILMVIGGLMGYGVLKMAERSKDSIRQGLEDYLKQSTGLDAQITDMIEVSLVPDVIFKMSGIIVRDSQQTLVNVEQFYVGAPLIDIFLGKKDYLGFEVKGFEAASGFLLPKKISVDYAGISDPKTSKLPPTLLVEGTYNKLPLMMTAEMDRWDRNGKAPIYRFKKQFPITFKLGDLEAGANFVQNMLSSELQHVYLGYKGVQAQFEKIEAGGNASEIKANGTIYDTNFNAELTKSGDSRVLKIMPETDDPKIIAQITKFITDIEKDIGINEKEQNFSFEIITKDTPKI